eukprot:TRINITY_DN1647_c0_g2_i1.p1 TRINITY_DN1647_c0_g2~~TRINITY_DN1647_c0_g2_i1.p1  ORF type:complete len:441 (+),score=53.00 TRINITY_DN1647_c0_g2_i1:106-1323(+)
MSEVSMTAVATKEDIRHAEKPRSSTHAEADIVATAVLLEYRGRDVEGNIEVSQQTVVAGIVAVDFQENFAKCLSIGVGTKFVQPDVLRSITNKEDVVKDCHAEILARRGLKKLLLEGYQLPATQSLVLYTSSAPCGDSTVKKWAKNSKTKPDTLPHAPLNMCARSSGQGIVCVKGEFSNDLTLQKKDGITTWPSGISAASGTTPAVLIPESDRGLYSATCSDKIASWSVLGVQGASLEQVLGKKYYLSAVVVGRKYGDATLRRALCCRLADPKKRPKVPVQHPTIMCTAIQLDDSVYCNGKGADFDSPSCLWWTSGMPKFQAIDGTTGLCPDGSPSPLSQSNLSLLFSQISDNRLGYDEAKALNNEYRSLKVTLVSHAHLLHNYPHVVIREKRKRPDQCDEQESE